MCWTIAEELVWKGGGKLNKGVPDTLGTLVGHSGARGPKGRGDTPWDTPLDTSVFGDTLGDTPRDTWARRAWETPVAGRRDRKRWVVSKLFLFSEPTIIIRFKTITRMKLPYFRII